MPNEEFLQMLKLVESWSSHDKEYLWESSLRVGAPYYAKEALEKLKAYQAELDKNLICV